MFLWAILIAMAASPGPSQTDARKQRRWTGEGIVAWSSMEPVLFHRRRGGAPVDIDERRVAEFSEAHVRRLKEAGVNLLIVSAHKGAGLKAEAGDMGRTRALVEVAHRNGLKVGGYVGASLLGETLFLEVPEARDWKQVDEWGRPIYYTAEQTFRYMACRNNPGYQAFIKKVLRIGVEELKLDLFHFDQLRWHPEPASCRCKYCEEEFRRYLRAGYDDRLRALRFGFANMDAVIPPPYGVERGPIPMTELRNPLMQEWASFRAENLARRYGELVSFVRSLNPEVAMQGNPTMNPAMNVGFAFGVDVSRLLEHGDFVWSEEPNLSEWTADGRLVSKIRSFKAARIMGKPMFAWLAPLPPEVYHTPVELRLAEAMAFNGPNLGSFRSLDEFTPGARAYVRFFHDRMGDLWWAETKADAAILRAFASIEFNPAEALAGTVLYEQALIQARVPFDIMFDRHLDRLARYKVLILADQDALSDAQIEKIRAFVAGGGGLVATGRTSMLTDWRMQRGRFGLSDLFGLEAPPAGGGSPKSIRRSHGKGRVAYIPRIDAPAHARAPQMAYAVENARWVLPRNSTDMIDAVRWAAGGGTSVEADAPNCVAMEVTEQRNEGKWLVHLVNYRTAEPVRDIAVRVRIPQGMRLQEAVLDTPDGGGRQVLPVVVKEDIAEFRVPLLRVYGLVALRWGS